MIGYCFLTYDSRLSRRVQDYIENQDPMFFSENRHNIARHWKFNTEDRNNMVRMLKDFKDLEVPSAEVLLFLRDIDFKLDSLKRTDADTI